MITDFIILLNNTCNLRCRYCHFTETHPERFIVCTPERVRKAVRLFFAHLSGHLTEHPVGHLSGQPEKPKVLCFNADGEALQTRGLLFEALEMADSLRAGRRDVILALVTNGTLIDAMVARSLARLGVSVTVSIDGGTIAHDRHRIGPGGSPTHQRTMAGIMHLQEAGVPLSVRAVVTPETSASLQDTYHFLKGLQPVRPIKLRPVRNTVYPFFSPTWISQFSQDFNACVKNLLKNGTLIDELPDDALYFGRFITRGESRGPYCAAGHGMLWMMPGGGLFPCGLLTEQDPCGHIDDLQHPGDLSALLDEAPSLRIRMNSPDQQECCGSCRWLRACGGGCPALGLDNAPPLCSFYQMLGKTMEEALCQT